MIKGKTPAVFCLDTGDWFRFNEAGQQLFAIRKRPVGNQRKARAPGVKCLASVHGTEQVGVEGGNRAVDHFFDEYFVDDVL